MISRQTQYGQMNIQFNSVLGRFAIYLDTVLVASRDTLDQAENYMLDQC